VIVLVPAAGSGQSQFQKLSRENSLRVDIGQDGVNPFYIPDPK